MMFDQDAQIELTAVCDFNEANAEVMLAAASLRFARIRLRRAAEAVLALPQRTRSVESDAVRVIGETDDIPFREIHPPGDGIVIPGPEPAKSFKRI